VTHQVDQEKVRNAMMELQEVVRVGQGEVHVQHVQDEHGQAPWGCSRESMNVPQEILALKLFKIRSTY
jgi:hypothetical protein